MKRTQVFLIFLLVLKICYGQVLPSSSFIKDLKWGVDYQINLTLANDSNYVVNVESLIHSNTVANDTGITDFVYYPVMLAKDFVDRLKESDVSLNDTSISTGKPASLWSALHSSLGGGWIHFIHCLQYSLETRYLSLTAPLMVRPDTKWKPKPVTQTYKRTRKWRYYVPVEQKFAHKEYILKKKENNLANLQDVPADFIQLFLQTNNKVLKKMEAAKDYKTQSKIDLVKLLLGANYLGNAQISYIKTMVLKSVLQYSFNQLPTIIVFDDLGAAVVMSLNENGYHLEKLVFRNAYAMSDEEKATNIKKIEQTIVVINKVNQKILEERLKKYYR
jgi:hypothetical protein